MFVAASLLTLSKLLMRARGDLRVRSVAKRQLLATVHKSTEEEEKPEKATECTSSTVKCSQWVCIATSLVAPVVVRTLSTQVWVLKRSFCTNSTHRSEHDAALFFHQLLYNRKHVFHFELFFWICSVPFWSKLFQETIENRFFDYCVANWHPQFFWQLSRSFEAIEAAWSPKHTTEHHHSSKLTALALVFHRQA